DGYFAQHLAGALGMTHVAFDESGVGPAHLGKHLARGKVDDLVHVETLVGFAPAQHGDVYHRCFLLLLGFAERRVRPRYNDSPTSTSTQVQNSSPMSSSTAKSRWGLGGGIASPPSRITSRWPSSASAISWRVCSTVIPTATQPGTSGTSA